MLIVIDIQASWSRALQPTTGDRSEGAVIAGGAKAAWFKASEGNILAIIQTLDGAKPMKRPLVGSIRSCLVGDL
jgi:hypothetical protein